MLNLEGKVGLRQVNVLGKGLPEEETTRAKLKRQKIAGNFCTVNGCSQLERLGGAQSSLPETARSCLECSGSHRGFMSRSGITRNLTQATERGMDHNLRLISLKLWNVALWGGTRWKAS